MWTSSPLFIHADILPPNFLYFKSVCCLKNQWSEKNFGIILKYNVWNTQFQTDLSLRQKLLILRTRCWSWAILPSKMAFESRGQNVTWHQLMTSVCVLEFTTIWPKGRKQSEREDDIALLAHQTIRVARTIRTSRALECTSFQLIRFWGENGLNLFEDIERISMLIRRTRRYALLTLRNHSTRDPCTLTWNFLRDQSYGLSWKKVQFQLEMLLSLQVQRSLVNEIGRYPVTF